MAVLMALLLGGCGAFQKVKEPGFQVIRAGGEYELRSYGEILAAETTVKAGFDDASGIAFRRLFGYISGKNRTRAKIAMTAPVTSEKKSVKIPMTAPVTMSGAKDAFVYQFIMPADYTMETLPAPLDPNVRLRKIEQRVVAVHRYSGTWSEENYRERLKKLREALKRDGIAVIGEPTWSRFNPPITPWFMRRNEIWLPVEVKQSPGS